MGLPGVTSEDCRAEEAHVGKPLGGAPGPEPRLRGGDPDAGGHTTGLPEQIRRAAPHVSLLILSLESFLLCLVLNGCF